MTQASSTQSGGNPVKALALKAVVFVLRLAVGGVFVFSGFTKCVDPLGSCYKFQEYVGALDLPWLAGSELAAAFFLPAVELVLGVLLVLGCCRRGVPILMLLLMCVMLPLTWHIATHGDVHDCGCFGDAWHLGNWPTFYKNVALTAGLAVLLFINRKAPGIYGPAVQWVVMALTFITGLLLSFSSYVNQPLIDFRPFKVGTRLVAPELADTSDDNYAFVYRDTRTGTTKEFGLDDTPDDDDPRWTFVERRVKREPLTPAQVAQARQIEIYDGGVESTAEALDSTRCQLLVLIPDLQGMNMAYAKSMNQLSDYCQKRDCAFSVVAAATSDEIEKWSDIALPQFKLYTGDDTQLKTVARGNPALVCVDRGVITWKSSLPAIKPLYYASNSTVPPQQLMTFKPRAALAEILATYFTLMAALLLLNRFYPVTRSAVKAVAGMFRKRRSGDGATNEDLEQE